MDSSPNESLTFVKLDLGMSFIWKHSVDIGKTGLKYVSGLKFWKLQESGLYFSSRMRGDHSTGLTHTQRSIDSILRST